ncbi:uroporphyrinogen-III synthase [Formivibrio citricus]|uniref:Uroporphyrinogen-III synthase n=1 Tax=Formivibrio citricus TaxID=83765 RepID=A0A1I5C5J7_9NEIS|nr:uroporphyrinogen-III synthase [Formivibrio citricus]SFN82124.1 uroporphyrinogen-III synthase [Formivibrio citricus]
MSSALAGHRIWITRPRNQSAGLRSLLEQVGAIPVLLPLLEIAPPLDTAPLQQALQNLDNYDLAVFVSPSALEKVFEHLPCPWPAGLPVAVMGPGSAARARELGIPAVIQPTGQFDSAGLLTEPALQDLAGKRVVLFRGESGREELPQTLRTRGASVDCIGAYRRLPPIFDETRLVAELAAGCDGIVVSSSEAAQHLFRLAGDKTRQQLQSQLYFAPHTRIVETLRGLGASSVRLTAAGDAGIMASVSHYFAPDSGPGNHREEQQNVG